MSYLIDFQAIDKDSFIVRLCESGYVLIKPKPGKHVWQEDELHLRSLLCTSTGHVVSAGFPKFFNYGEHPDRDRGLVSALQYGLVDFQDKVDGSLIIASMIDGKLHWRTRGQDTLGAFTPAIQELLDAKYPDLAGTLEDCLGELRCSALFEYVGPDNRIVLDYPEAELYFLGTVDHDTLYVSRSLNSVVGTKLLSSKAPNLPTSYGYMADKSADITRVLHQVKKWKNREGVVAYYLNEGRLTLVKIKTDEYIRLHTLKFRLAGKAHILAFLLGARTKQEAEAKFMELGIDAEGLMFVADELQAYEDNLQTITAAWEHFQANVNQLREATYCEDPAAHRKQFVQVLKTNNVPHFSAAMLIFDGRLEDAWISVVAQDLLGTPVNTVRTWLADKEEQIKQFFGPVPDTE